jgi:hypothetical protein
LGQPLDVGGDVHRPDSGEGQAVPLAPGEEVADGPGIRLAGVRISNGGGEEHDEGAAGPLPGVGDDGGQEDAAANGEAALICGFVAPIIRSGPISIIWSEPLG